MTSVAEAAKVPLSQLKTISHHAMGIGYLTEPKIGHLGHSDLSALLTSDSDFNSWAYFMSDIMIPTSQKTVEATERFGHSIENTETAFNVALGTDKPMFEWLFADPTRAQHFARFARAMAKTGDRHPKYLIEGFDWEGVKIVVDVRLHLPLPQVDAP